jgi:hypothetical protein
LPVTKKTPWRAARPASGAAAEPAVRTVHALDQPGREAPVEQRAQVEVAQLDDAEPVQRARPAPEADLDPPERGRREAAPEPHERAGARQTDDAEGAHGRHRGRVGAGRGAEQHDGRVGDREPGEEQEPDPHPHRRRPGDDPRPRRPDEVVGERLEDDQPAQHGDRRQERVAERRRDAGVEHQPPRDVPVRRGEEPDQDEGDGPEQHAAHLV